MAPIYNSPIYTLHPDGYAADNQERMIAHLDDFYWKCFFMMSMNRVEGDYLEFGCGSNIRSFRLAYKYRTLQYQAPRLFAFDSFAGLPAPAGIDAEIHTTWKEGSMAVPLDVFNATLAESGAVVGRDYHTVPGFFEDTLAGKSPQEYGIEKAAMIMVDCDLFASTVLVLNFISSILTDGLILAFDDWFCYRGRKDRGEQRALHEFLIIHPEVSLSEYQNFGWHGKSFIVHLDD